MDAASTKQKFHSLEPDRLVSGLHSRGTLSHLKREGASYFVTFRLADTLPSDVLLHLKKEREKILHSAEADNRPLTWNEQKEFIYICLERMKTRMSSPHSTFTVSP